MEGCVTPLAMLSWGTRDMKAEVSAGCWAFALGRRCVDTQSSRLGFGGLGFRVQSSGFGVKGKGFKVWVESAGYRILDAGLRVQGLGLRV